MTNSQRALGWLRSLGHAALVVLVGGASAWADGPSGSCDGCKTRALKTVDWTAIYLGDFATGCALANPYEAIIRADGYTQSSAWLGAWCPDPAVLAHDPYPILRSTTDWGLLIDGGPDSLSIEPLCCDFPPLDCPCRAGAEANTCQSLCCEPSARRQAGETEPCCESPLQLKPGEAAAEILELVRRLGPRPCEGTIFDDDTRIIGVPIPGHDRCFRELRNDESLARALRSLEAQERQRRDESGTTIEAMFEDSATDEPLRPSDTFDRVEPIEKTRESTHNTPEQIGTLRHTGRMLDEAANLLEEQGLYDRADELRGMAQQLREDARAAKAQCLEPVQYRDTGPKVRYWGIDTPHVEPPRR